MAGLYDTYPIHQLNIFGACVSGSGLFVTCIILSYTICTHEAFAYMNYVWILSYMTMVTYTGGQIATFINYIYRAINNNEMYLVLYCSTFFFNFISMFLVLIVFISRIRLLFQKTPLQYPPRLLFVLYVFIATVPIASMTTLGFLIYANYKEIEPNTGSKVYVIIYIVIAYHLIIYLLLAIILLIMFINRLIRIQINEKVSDNEQRQETIKLQSKITVLGTICLGSTIIIAIINYTISETLYYIISDFWMTLMIDIDCMIGSICIAFTIKHNQKIYEKTCFLCVHCLDKMVSLCTSSLSNDANKSSIELSHRSYSYLKVKDTEITDVNKL